MKVRIRPANMRPRVAACFLAVSWTALAGAGILLGWPTAVWVDSELAQWSGARELERQILRAQEEPLTAARDANRLEEVVVHEPPVVERSAKAPGEVLGRLEIPRLKISYILLEGTDARMLDRSIGHIRNTALPGQAGNIGIAGHRNTHFRRLEWIRRDDEIVLTSPQGAFHYRVEWAALFKPSDLEVLDPSQGPALTLVTCFPFEYVGSAPLRFVVRALPHEQTLLRLQPQSYTVAAGD
jgi:sortase A